MNWEGVRGVSSEAQGPKLVPAENIFCILEALASPITKLGTKGNRGSRQPLGCSIEYKLGVNDNNQRPPATQTLLIAIRDAYHFCTCLSHNVVIVHHKRNLQRKLGTRFSPGGLLLFFGRAYLVYYMDIRPRICNSASSRWVDSRT